MIFLPWEMIAFRILRPEPGRVGRDSMGMPSGVVAVAEDEVDEGVVPFAMDMDLNVLF